MIKTSIEKSDLLIVKCVDIDQSGYGVCTFNAQVIIVPGLTVGDEALVRSEYILRGTWYGSIKSIRTLSAHRVKPACYVFDQCGGCTLQHTLYTQQNLLKQKILNDSLMRIANIKDFPITSHLNPTNYYNYRNKAIIPTEVQSDGSFIIGYYKRGSHTIVDINSCPILTDQMNEIYKIIQNSFANNKFLFVPQNSPLRSITHIYIRHSIRTNEILIAFISKRSISYYLSSFANYFKQQEYNIVGFVNNIQPQDTNTILGTRSEIIYGRNYINERFCNLYFKIGIRSFFQINIIEAEKAVNLILDHVTKTYKCKRIIDAYSGIGTISLPLAKTGLDIIGVEINSEAYKLSLENIIANSIKNVNYILGDVSKSLSNILQSSDYLIVDPPRKGLDKSIIDLILNKQPQNIAYLSCNPSTLGRDLSLLLKGDLYKINNIYSFDFFPQTMHLESLVFLTISSS
ncbi:MULTISPECIES: 23S rRNA (uracil(1939)-C(5))-methyltransferase RlmD [unclassified Prochlorococcus]|nr:MULTISPECIES: 23S rRNA (uracil(1939)-C(5))-methyltransferase RlmD [unclassified Prochlorococcus]KGG15287.1 RNA methyltransferase [Prochlorococcus sp. MIT 0602]KGG17565.1 RNA methyltransferase [Prochlorococcus sp. MIT 0603]